jgi:hypothetical protein
MAMIARLPLTPRVPGPRASASKICAKETSHCRRFRPRYPVDRPSLLGQGSDLANRSDTEPPIEMAAALGQVTLRG